jgi:hypothetical protein
MQYDREADTSGDKEMENIELIRSVELSNKEVHPGESFRVAVETQPLEQGGRVDVYINGLLGGVQYLHFDGAPGPRTIHICAATKGRSERTEAEVKVVATDNVIQYPQVDARINPFHHMTIDLNIINAAGLNLRSPSYLWEFGDGQTTRTTIPAASHCYESSLENEAPYTSFQAKISIREAGRFDRTLYKTLTIWNYSYTDKQNGLIKPRVETGGKVVRSEEKLVGSFIIKNVEDEVLQFQSRRIDFLSATPDRKSLAQPEEEFIFGVGPKESSIQHFEIPFASVPKDVFGFAVHLRGKSATGLKVSGSVYFTYKDPPGVSAVTSPAAIAMLNKIRDTVSLRNPNVITDQSLYELLRSGKFGFDPSGMPSTFVGKVGAPGQPSQGRPVEGTFDILGIDPNIVNIITNGNSNQPPALPPALQQMIGQECNCQACPYPDPRVTCQLTSEVRWVRVPAHFPNARKGDVILSPGGSDLIGRLLMQLSPPQVHAHSGIMTKDYFEFRHSTASEERIKGKEYFTGTFLGEPMPTDGLRPDHVKYGWPGTITQSVDAAYLSSQAGGPGTDPPQTNQPDPVLFPFWLQDPENLNWYPIRTLFFSPNTVKEHGEWLLVSPMVVKPPWELEPAVRDILNQVADQALTLSGHYRFFAYTAADISLNAQYAAPASSGWANGTLPTVCSSFIWTAIQTLNQKLATQGLRQIDLDGTRGGPMDNQTLDGLYFYSEADRLNAATELYNHIYMMTQQQIAETIPSWFGVSVGFVLGILSGSAPEIPALAAALGISQAAANDFVDLYANLPTKIANQICNAFASDWCDQGAIDSSNWQNPGVGRGVSPDNILAYWDQPNPAIVNKIHGLYGFAENLLIVPGRWEQRQVCRWTQSLGVARLFVLVTYHGAHATGAFVQVACQEAYVPIDGDPQITIPSGRYLATASILWTNGWFLQGSTDFTIQPNEEKTIEIILQDPPEVNRNIVLDGWMDIYDYQVIGSDNWDHPHFHHELLIGPPPPSAQNQALGTSASYQYDSGDDVGLTGGETHVALQVTTTWLNDLSAVLRVQAMLFDGNDVDLQTNNFQQPWVVAKDHWATFTMNMDNGETASDGVNIHITITNQRQSA